MMIYCSVITSLSEQPCESIPSAGTGRVSGVAFGRRGHVGGCGGGGACGGVIMTGTL